MNFNAIEPLLDHGLFAEVNSVSGRPHIFIGSEDHQYGIDYPQAILLRDWLIKATTPETPADEVKP